VQTFTINDYNPPAGVIAQGAVGKDFGFTVDGLNQRGLAFYPQAYAAPNTLPVIVFYSGGKSGADAKLNDAHVQGNLVGSTGLPPTGDIGYGHSSRVLWNNGYIQITPQGRGRGSLVPGETWTGGGLSDGVDEFGVADLEDYVAAEELRHEFPSAHPTKTVYIGTSRGGMEMALVLAKKGKAPDAAIFKSALVDLDDWGIVQQGRYAIPDFEAPDETVFENLGIDDQNRLHMRTATRFTDLMPTQTEYLVIHGDADTTAPLEGVRKLVRRLRLFGANVQFEIIPGGAHGLRNTPAIIQQVAEIERDFLARVVG